ncbi:MAG: hypothetical protein ACHQII_02370 [Bacteroidia bacterium]
MKKVFALSVSLLVCMLIGFACTKSSTTTNTTTASATTTSAPINTTVTNYTVDGTAASNPISSTNNSSGDYLVTGIDGSHQYPKIEIVFPGTSSPVSNTYAIVNTGASPAAGTCKLILVTTSGSYPASSGNVTVAAGASSSAQFSNITCSGSGTTHTVTGNVKWP